MSSACLWAGLELIIEQVKQRKKPMTMSRAAALTIVALVAIYSASTCSLSAAQDDAVELVGQLPTGPSFRLDVTLEKNLLDLGPKALPALENELRLGIRSKDLNELLKSGGSRRCAVVTALCRIPGDKSTDLLVRSLSDPPDCYGMTVGILIELSKRNLSNEQIAAMLGNNDPQIVLAGIDHAVKNIAHLEVKTAVERVFDKDAALAQFHNEYGASTADPESLWKVRLASGRALNQDMIPEIRVKAQELLVDLRKEALHPTDPNKSVFISSGSRAELTICNCLNKLSVMGQPIKDLVEGAAKEAEGDHAKYLDMALAQLGDRTQLAKVTTYLIDAENPTVRFCAAITLRTLKDRSSVPALRRALHDPYQRQHGSCVQFGNRMIYPIRVVAADALVDLGEDPKEIHQEMRK